jgi:hypothetical protein
MFGNSAMTSMGLIAARVVDKFLVEEFVRGSIAIEEELLIMKLVGKAWLK